jgi:phosphoglycerol transferase MdoB-like AlkP superfamily enzyme
MKNRFFFILKYFVFWVFVFICFRILFVGYHIGKFPDIRLLDYLLIFTHGLVLDLSITGYIMLLPVLLLLLSFWFWKTLFFKISNIYTVFMLFLVFLLHIIDLELYSYWGFRLDETFLEYINTPKDMLASLSWFHYPILLAALAICCLFFYHLIYKKFVLHGNMAIDNSSWHGSLAFSLVIPALILPIRGGMGTSPVNTGAVYFHENVMVNHAAINPVWNLAYTLTVKDKLKFSVSFFEQGIAEEMMKKLDPLQGTSINVLNTDRPNIMIIILESFSAHMVKELGGTEGITPNLSRYVHEGILFTNFFSAHSSSSRGIGAILSGYPGLPHTCILYYENKTENLPAISKDLKGLGYQSSFFYGGDIDFGHMKSFLLNCGFHHIISDKDFSKSDYYLN